MQENLPLPSPLWSSLADAAESVPAYLPPADDEWAENDSGANPSLWRTLRDRLDFAQYRPARAEDTDIAHLTTASGEEYYVLKNPTAGTYMKLTPNDYFVWHQIDGEKTVKDLVVEYFRAFGAFAFARIGSLIAQLKDNHFLSDAPMQTYGPLTRQLESRSLRHRLNALWSGFMQFEIALNGIDGFISATYRSFFFLFATWPARLLYLIATFYGMFCFYQILSLGQYNFIQQNNSYKLGVVTLILINAVVLSIHEASHAYSCKSYGREVRRGGFLMYFGLPAFFVDTMDIWMEPRRARMNVSWAGPYSGLILAGLCAILIAHFPGSPFNSILFKMAFLAYLSVFMNLNPLMELDGYFMLMDWLEMPMMRARSLHFIKTDLAKKLAQRQPWSREEVIMTVYGLLAAVWSGLAILMALYFWKTRLAQMAADLWHKGGVVSYILLGVLIVGMGLPIAMAVINQLLEAVRKMLGWLNRTGVFRPAINVFAALLLLTILIVGGLLALKLPDKQSAALFACIAVAGLCIGIYLVRSILRYYRKSQLESLFSLFQLALAFLVFPFAFRFLNAFGYTPARFDSFTIELTMLALFGLFLFAGVSVVFSNNDLKSYSNTEKAVLFSGIALAFIPLIPVLAWNPGVTDLVSLWNVIIVCVAVYLHFVALVLMISNIMTYLGTDFEYAWILIAAGLAVHLIGVLQHVYTVWHVIPGGLVRLETLYLLSVLLTVSGLFLYNVILSRLTGWDRQDTIQYATTERDLLYSVFKQFYQALYRRFCSMGGKRHAKLLEDQLNLFAISAGYQITFADETVYDHQPQIPIVETAEVCRVLLARVITEITSLVGITIIERTIMASYDRLYWQSREIADQYLLQALPWASNLNREDAQRNADDLLLSKIPLFAELSANQLGGIKSMLKVQTFYPGQNVITRGEIGETFYIMRVGKVEVIAPINGQDKIVTELSAGDSFGEIALLKDIPRTASVRAKTLSEMFVLDKRDFKALASRFDDLEARFQQAIETSNIIRRMPLFEELSADQTASLMSKFSVQLAAKGETIIRQGEVGDRFYILKQGKVDVLVWDGSQYKPVAYLGPGEYFGEIALLLNIPRTSTIRALEDCELMTLTRKDFNEVFGANLLMSRSLEQVSSRRLLDTQQKTGIPNTTSS
ncbi:MAG: cyclic nucleotide-binding domain-containing protein [Solirubrobacterales bacterium]